MLHRAILVLIYQKYLLFQSLIGINVSCNSAERQVLTEREAELFQSLIGINVSCNQQPNFY